MDAINDAKRYLSGLKKFRSQEDALNAAVRKKKTDENAIDMVMRQRDGKFVVCGYQYWEDAINFCGCDPVYSNGYIYDIAAGRNPSEDDNRKDLSAIKGGPVGVKKAVSYDQLRGNT